MNGKNTKHIRRTHQKRAARLLLHQAQAAVEGVVHRDEAAVAAEHDAAQDLGGLGVARCG